MVPVNLDNTRVQQWCEMNPQLLREYLMVITEFAGEIGTGLFVAVCLYVVLRGK